MYCVWTRFSKVAILPGTCVFYTLVEAYIENESQRRSAHTADRQQLSVVGQIGCSGIAAVNCAYNYVFKTVHLVRCKFAYFTFTKYVSTDSSHLTRLCTAEKAYQCSVCQ